MAYMGEDQPVKPANILNIVAMNQGKRPLTIGRPKGVALTPAEVQERMAAGHRIVDARSSPTFGAGHIQGSFNVQKSSSEFEQRIGWVVPDDSPIILVTDSDEDVDQCLYDMAFIGLDQSVTGFLEGGIKAWMAAGLPLETTGQMDVHTLRTRLSENGLQALDVRDSDEWYEGHIEGAHFMPYTSMARQLDVPDRIDELTVTPDQTIAVVCGTGQRSSTAISLLLQRGYERLYNVTGGMVAWQDAGFPTVVG